MARRSVLEMLAERESIYKLLPQTTPDRLHKNVTQVGLALKEAINKSTFSSVHYRPALALSLHGHCHSAGTSTPSHRDRQSSRIRQLARATHDGILKRLFNRLCTLFQVNHRTPINDTHRYVNRRKTQFVQMFDEQQRLLSFCDTALLPYDVGCIEIVMFK